MLKQKIYNKISLLSSEKLEQELLNYLEYLLNKQHQAISNEKRTPKFGCAKGRFKMVDDFNESIEDFKDYMP